MTKKHRGILNIWNTQAEVFTDFIISMYVYVVMCVCVCVCVCVSVCVFACVHVYGCVYLCLGVIEIKSLHDSYLHNYSVPYGSKVLGMHRYQILISVSAIFGGIGSVSVIV